MYTLLIILSLSLLAMIALGVFYEINPIHAPNQVPKWLKGSVGINIMVFMGSLIAMLFFGINEVMAEGAGKEVAGQLAQSDISVGKGLAIIGIGLPTSFATIGAGISVGPIGAASLAAISEKPENFGRSLIYLGLAEGIAIYGLVVTILLLGKI